MAKKKGAISNPGFSGTLESFLLQLISKVGITGTIVFVVLYIFVKFADDGQKKMFIDIYILFRNVDGVNWFPYVLLVCLVVLYLIMWFYYYTRTKLKDSRIEELIEERNELQTRLFGKRGLASSN